MLKRYIAVILLLCSSLTTVQSLIPAKSIALAGGDFRAGRIIDDATFFNFGSMSTASIQAFLESKVPACDINGTKMYNNTLTRAQYGASKGYPGPYTCLRDYTQVVPSKAADKYCPRDFGGGTKSAAQIIYDVSYSCGVNPKVLIVLLQKEESLITDDWPWSSQYRSATGYGCPDTAPCDAQYYGFFNQVYSAARQYQRYTKEADLYSFKAGRTSYIQYNPVASCSGANVYLETQATAALYNYTPYQPNQAALNNLNGSGDGCSAYGNRNFWRTYYEWFGTPYNLTLPGCGEATNTTLTCVWRLRDPSNRQVLVTSIGERDNLAINGDIYEGIAFYGRVAIAPSAGNIPVFRLTDPNGQTFLTTDYNERTVLINNGYQDRGVDFNADPAGANSGYPVYRMYSSATNTHIWTSNEPERTLLLNTGFNSEGIAFNALSPVRQEVAPPSNKLLVYRFSGMPNNGHFWTTDIQERDSMVNSGYNYEGVAWYGARNTSDLPIYRLYSSSLKDHLYTSDVNEKNTLVGIGWTYEGISQYMTSAANSAPIYRLYSPITYNHLWTSSQNERDTLVRSGSFRYEGISWYQPS